MGFFSLSDIQHSIGTRSLFDQLTFGLERGERVGLIGMNGSGKSTLLKIMAGEVVPDEGRVIAARGTKVQYVPQVLPVELSEQTVFECIGATLSGGYLGKESDYLIEYWVERVGVRDELLFSRLGTLSGGEVNRVLLARALAAEPDLLLLDEPTNHMDVEAVIKFEDFLRSELQCATVIVSHDRELLDRVTDRTAILRDGRVRVFDAPCSRARVLLREADEADRRRWAAEQREVERLQAAADQLSHWAATFDNEKFAKRARSIERRIDKMELERTELSRERTAQVQCAPRRTESGLALRIEGLRLATPVGRALFSVPNLVVRRGERIAICGPNGAGKSTLLRELMATAAGARSVDSIRINPTVSIGYYDQELRHFRRGLTVLDAVGEVAATNRGKAGAILARAGFMFERQNTPIELLSGGEQARLTFLAMELSRPSLLILDEPTNHLDLDGIERLEESLVSAEGSCLFVSHDRRFVERVATRVLSVREGVLGEWGAT